MELCLGCDKRDSSKCTIVDMEFNDFINLRLAYCPLFKW
mgnify:FL=1